MPSTAVEVTADPAVNRFAFVIHPLSIEHLHRHHALRWCRRLPEASVERLAAHLPPLFLSRITGARSAATGQRVEGLLYGLSATPREMLRRPPRFTYDRLLTTARRAARKGARILGLGAFTSVVGDAGITVAEEAEIAITSGNSLTVAATLEAARQAVERYGLVPYAECRAMVIGATGSIGSVCSRLLAREVRHLDLVSIEPDRLVELAHIIATESPGAELGRATRADGLLAECDLVITATSAFGQRVLDIARARPGAVVCDVARPPDISAAEAALRPDVLVIESGEVVIPGEVDFGYDIGLPHGTSYACLGETALLAMAGRFEHYTVGRRIHPQRVEEIRRLFFEHGFRIAPLRAHGTLLTDGELAGRRELALALRADPEMLDRVRVEAAARLAAIPPRSKGVAAPAPGRPRGLPATVSAGAGLHHRPGGRAAAARQ
jgi:predicted amino acid dehydrogenase